MQHVSMQFYCPQLVALPHQWYRSDQGTSFILCSFDLVEMCLGAWWKGSTIICAGAWMF